MSIAHDGDHVATGLHRELRHRVQQRLLVTCQQRDIGAFEQQRAGDGLADALAAAGDERALALELEIHGCPSLWW